MNKTAIKNFAVWARQKLISDITYKAGMLGVTDNGIAQPLKQSTQDLQFFEKPFLFCLGILIGLLTKLLHLRIAHQLLSILHIPDCLIVGVIGLNDRL